MLTLTKLFSRLTTLALLGAMVALAAPVFQANAMDHSTIVAPESPDRHPDHD